MAACLMFVAGRKWRGIWVDPNQLGGDFIADKGGILRLVHPSRTAIDRPSMDEIMALLRGLS